MSETIAIIPVRSGSKRVPKKNIRPVEGVPLFVWSIKAALETDSISRVIVSTDDPDAIDIARALPVEVWDRPSVLAQDNSSSFDVLKHVCGIQCAERNINPDIAVLLQPTSPLRERGLLEAGISLLKNDPSLDRVLELNHLKIYSGLVTSGLWRPDFPDGTRSQDLPLTYFPSGRFFGYRVATTVYKDNPNGKKTGTLLGDYATNVNIDEESDFDKMDYVLSKNSGKYEHLFR